MEVLLNNRTSQDDFSILFGKMLERKMSQKSIPIKLKIINCRMCIKEQLKLIFEIYMQKTDYFLERKFYCFTV